MTSVAELSSTACTGARTASQPALAPRPRPPAGGGLVLAVPLQDLALDESWGGVDGDINGSGLGAC